MEYDPKTYDRLIALLQALDPLLIDAIDECDDTLIEEFSSLSLLEKIRWASEGAGTLERLKPR